MSHYSGSSSAPDDRALADTKLVAAIARRSLKGIRAALAEGAEPTEAHGASIILRGT